MRHLAIERLKEAVRSEYAGQVTFRTHDARAILALLDGDDPGPEPEDDFEADPDDDQIA